jgi:hypothetical protein
MYQFAELVAGAGQQQHVNVYLKSDVDDTLLTTIKAQILKRDRELEPLELTQMIQLAVEKEVPPLVAFLEDNSLIKGALLAGRDQAWEQVRQMTPKVTLANLMHTPPLLKRFATLTARLIARADEAHKKVATSHVGRDILEASLLEADMAMRQELRRNGFPEVKLSPWG